MSGCSKWRGIDCGSGVRIDFTRGDLFLLFARPSLVLPCPCHCSNLHRLLTEEMRTVLVRTAGLELGSALLRPGAGLMEELTRIAMAAQRLPSDDLFL